MLDTGRACVEPAPHGRADLSNTPRIGALLQVVAALRVPAASVGAEAKVLLGLGQHPHLVRFIGMFRDAEDMVLITEYAPLGSLDKHIEEVEDDITADHKMVIISQVRVCW